MPRSVMHVLILRPSETTTFLVLSPAQCRPREMILFGFINIPELTLAHGINPTSHLAIQRLWPSVRRGSQAFTADQTACGFLELEVSMAGLSEPCVRKVPLRSSCWFCCYELPQSKPCIGQFASIRKTQHTQANKRHAHVTETAAGIASRKLDFCISSLFWFRSGENSFNDRCPTWVGLPCTISDPSLL